MTQPITTKTVAGAHVHRWADLPRDEPMPLLSRRRVIGERVMISEIRLEAGCSVPTHTHENEQMALVVSGKMRFGIGAEDAPERRTVELGAGEVLHLPPNVPHSADAVESSVVIDVFSPIAEKTGIDRD